MTQEELVTTSRLQAAFMMVTYHQALNAMLNELVAALPPQYPHGREPYRRAIRRFRAEVEALAVSWCRS